MTRYVCEGICFHGRNACVLLWWKNDKEPNKTRKEKKKKNGENLIPWIKHTAEQNGRPDTCRYFSVAFWSVEGKDADSLVHSIMLHHWGRERETGVVTKILFISLTTQTYKVSPVQTCTQTDSDSLSMGLLDRAEKVKYMT